MSSPSPVAAQANTPPAAARWGVALGILVFLVGVALVGYVFAEANRLFHTPPPSVPAALPAPTPSGAGADAAASSNAASGAALEIGRSLTQFLQQLLVLLVMCVAGSVIASKGVQLMFASARAARPE